MTPPRRRALLLAAGVAIACAVAAAAARAKPTRPSAKQGFDRIRAVATPATDEALEPCFPASLVERRFRKKADRIAKWRRAYHGRLGGARVLKAIEVGDHAYVKCRASDGMGEIMVALAWQDPRWVVAAPREYTTKGAALEAANGRKPARIRLTARTTNSAYGTSAFSFGCVTQDAKACLGRLDIWYCLRGHLHLSGQGRAVEIGKTSLHRAKDIPFDGEWMRTLRPAPGRVYVMHVRYEELWDFYVRFKVRTADAKHLELEWELLALGERSPKDIHTAQPLEGDERLDGGRGWDGLCGG